MRTVAVVACRLESTRLYGKPMHLLGYRPIIAHLLSQLRLPHRIDEIVLAISDGPGQNVFVEVAKQEGLRWHIGSEMDVLRRTVESAEMADAETVIRVTPDCPFAYWDNVDEMIETHERERAALTVTEHLPHGTAVEVIDLATLRWICDSPDSEARHHEHSTMYISEHPNRYKILRRDAPEDLRRPDIRLTVDLPEDLILMRRIYDALAAEGEPIPVRRIVQFLDANPEVRAINGSIETLHLWR
jgi:spore coat polysaccharide biosynthesis protein SpsF